MKFYYFAVQWWLNQKNLLTWLRISLAVLTTLTRSVSWLSKITDAGLSACCLSGCLLTYNISDFFLYYWLKVISIKLLITWFIYCKKDFFFSNISTAFNKGEILVLQKGIHDTGSFIKKIFSSGIISVQSYY